MDDHGDSAPARPASRRSVLAALAAGAAALVASVTGRIPSARAADTDPLVLGQANTASSETSLTRTPASASTDNALKLSAVGSATALRAVTVDGTAIVGGATGTGVGVRGEGAQGVVGDSPDSLGVYGITGGAGSGYGVYGQHGDSSEDWTGGGTGVYGVSYSSNGYGVFGESPNYGVYGQTDSGQAGFFLAKQKGGIGVRASAPNGTALSVNGKAVFSRSGRVTIPAHAASETVVGVALSPQSLVLAVLQSDVAGVAVRAVVTDPAHDTFTVFLTRRPPVDVDAAWFVLS